MTLSEAKIILQDIKLFEQTQQSLAMLKILALSNQNLREGKMKPIANAFLDIRNRIDESKK